MSLALHKLEKIFYDRDEGQSVHALQDINLTVAPGEFVSVIGPSGCGKSTLLRIIAGLETQTSGDIVLQGRKHDEPWRDVGFVFQEYALFPWRTVRENIEFPLEIKKESKKHRRDKARSYIDRFGMSGFENAYPREISGGMKQRVAIARTLVDDSRIILMDEPFGALDSQTRSNMQTFLLELWQNLKRTIVFVTHNVDEAIFLSNRVICLTARPGTIGLELPIDLPYSRDVTGDEFNCYRRQILSFLETHNA